MFFDEPKYYIIASIVAVLCLFFVVLYMRFQNMKEQRKRSEEDTLIREGELKLKQDYFQEDGSVNPMPFVFDDTAIDVEDEDAAEAKGEGGSTEKKPKKPKTIVNKVVDSLKNGNLLKTINRFAVRTNQLTERLAAKDTSTEEEKIQREKYGRLADDAVNPLLALRLARINKEREEHVQRKAAMQERHAAAAALLQKDVEKKIDCDDDIDDKKEETLTNKENTKNGIYQFNAEQLEQLSKVMSGKTIEAKKTAEKEERGYLGEGGVDGAVQGAFQTEATRKTNQ